MMVQVPHSSQGKSEVANSEGFRGAGPSLNSGTANNKVVTSCCSITTSVSKTHFVPILFLDTFRKHCLCFFGFFKPIFLHVSDNFYGFGPFWTYFITNSTKITSTLFVMRAQSGWKHRSLQLSVMHTMTTSVTGFWQKSASVTKSAGERRKAASGDDFA